MKPEDSTTTTAATTATVTATINTTTSVPGRSYETYFDFQSYKSCVHFYLFCSTLRNIK
jgi:hypothetical protein